MALTAIPVGFIAGLFGVGGGLITVPVLFYIFNSMGLDRSFIMHLAVGTSFAIIIPTSFISTMTHMKFKVKLTNFKTKFDGIKLFFIPINIKIDREQEFNKLITDYVTNHKRNR